MKKRKIVLALLPLLFMATSFLTNTCKETEKVLAGSADSYYTTAYSDDVTGKKGDALLNSLKTIMNNSHKKYTTYEELKTVTLESDKDPNKDGNIILFYSRASIPGEWASGKTWNREHVWPQSLSGGLYGETKAGADLHHLRPADPSVNSSRGNTPFGELKDFSGTISDVLYNNTPTGNRRISSTVFEPRDDIKGDVARILMYLHTHYYDEGKLNIVNTIATASGSESAAWDLMVKWNEEDPVDNYEVIRNEYAYGLQGNRNPYIDHPEFAKMVYDANYSGEGALLDQGNTSGLTRIEILGDFAKKTYFDGDDWNPTGLIIAAKYQTGDSKEVTSGATFTYSPKNAVLGTTSVEVTATYGDLTSNKIIIDGIVVNKKAQSSGEIKDGGKYFITATKDSKTYVLKAGIFTAGNSESTTEFKVDELTESDAWTFTAGTELNTWHVSATEGTGLYHINKNNGVISNADGANQYYTVSIADESNGLIYMANNNRYLSLYSAAPNFRCYKNTNENGGFTISGVPKIKLVEYVAQETDKVENFVNDWYAMREAGGEGPSGGICAFLKGDTTKLEELLVRYEAFGPEEKKIISETIDLGSGGGTDPDATIGETIEYIRAALGLTNSEVSSGSKSNETLLSTYSGTTSIVAFFAVLGLVAVSAYYFIEKRKLVK